MIEIIEHIFSILLLFLFIGNAIRAERSWRKGYEIEAIWRMLNAIFWAVIYYGYYAWL